MNEVIIRIIDTANDVQGDLDLTNFNDFPLAINKGIVNLDNLKERTGTFTKMFKVPNSKNNTNLLSNVDNINSRKDFRDCLNRKPCIILVNNNPIEHGFVQVVKAFNDFRGGYFELVFYGDNIDWVKDAAEFKVNTIIWRNNTEQYRESTINNLNALTVSNTDIAYPYISRGGNESTDSASVEDFIPCIYLKSIITNCFNSIGYKIESSFINEVDTLVCDLNLKFQQSKIDIDESKVRATMTIPTFVNVDLLTTKRIIFNNDFTFPNVDEKNYYNPTTGIYTIPTTGTYLVTVLLGINVATFDQAELKLIKNGVSTTSIGTGLELDKKKFDTTGTFENTFEVTLSQNDELSFYVNPDEFSENLVSFSSGSYFKIQLTSEIKRKDLFSVNTMIPDSVKFLDILNDFTRMFNIYYWTDVKSKMVYFEPRDVFFNSQTTALDWSGKLDLSSGYEVDYVSSYKRTVNFSYKKPNKDEYLKEWKDLNRREYGEYNYKLPDRFNEGTTTIKLDFFSATYGHKALEATPTNREAFSTLKIWNEFKTKGATPDTRIVDYNPRIFFFKNGGQASSDSFKRAIVKFDISDDTNIPYGVFETYDNIEPQINLNFADGLKKNETTIDIGLFARFYSKMFKNIQEGGRIIAYFDLSPTDIQNLDFRDLIYLDGESNVKGYYIVEKVIDYNPLNTKLTKVSLFKFEDLGSVSIDDTQEGNNDTETDDGLTPPELDSIFIEGEYGTSSEGVVDFLLPVFSINPVTEAQEQVFK